MDKLSTIPKFEGPEFHTWQIKIQLLLIEKDLWDIVNGTIQKPQDADEITKWTAKDHRASALIGLGLSDAYLHHIDLSKTSKEIWDGINTLFGSQASSAKMSIKHKLFRLKMNEGDNIVQHISTFHSLLNQLAVLNSKIDDDDAKAILLSSMPSSFDHIVFTLNKMNPNLETIISSLIDEGSRAHKSHNFIEDCALFARKKSSVPGRRELKCFYCQQSGHIQMNCFQQAKDLIDGKLKKNTQFFVVEGETNYCDFTIHSNIDDCDSPPEIDTRFLH